MRANEKVATINGIAITNRFREAHKSAPFNDFVKAYAEKGSLLFDAFGNRIDCYVDDRPDSETRVPPQVALCMRFWKAFDNPFSVSSMIPCDRAGQLCGAAELGLDATNLTAFVRLYPMYSGDFEQLATCLPSGSKLRKAIRLYQESLNA